MARFEMVSVPDPVMVTGSPLYPDRFSAYWTILRRMARGRRRHLSVDPVGSGKAGESYP